MNRVVVQVEVRSGPSLWMGQGRDLAEALMSLSGVIPGPGRVGTDPDVLAALQAIAPVPISFRMSVRSLARWWRPSTWGTVDILMGSEVPR